METCDAKEVWVVLSTFPDLKTARQIGTALIEAQLAACVNLLPPAESIYRWEGKVERATEIPALFKTTRAAWPAFRDRLAELHPYEVPEIIALPVRAGLPAYLHWVAESVK